MPIPKSEYVVICDIDGTLAKMNGRSPYDWMRVKEDKVNEPVKYLLNALGFKFEIILFSGRDEVCRKLTEEWLIDNAILYSGKLYMRPKGNNQDDRIVKRAMYEEHIVKTGKKVIFVLDDRNKVVDMWRKDLGLACFQVDYGDF